MITAEVAATAVAEDVSGHCPAEVPGVIAVVVVGTEITTGPAVEVVPGAGAHVAEAGLEEPVLEK